MKFTQAVNIKEIAKTINAQIIGDENGMSTGINEIHKVNSGDITYVDFHKYYSFALNSEATYIIIDKQIECPTGKSLLICNDPFNAYNFLAKQYRPFIASSKSISETAQIGEGTIIQPNVFVGNHVKIGKNCVIHPNVTIYDYSEIGDNVIIHSNTVIGCDAFYYKGRPEVYEKMHTIGRAIIEDDVEIGACCAISSGVSGDTIIGAGTKLDNHIHIGHGTILGKKCLLAAHTAIAGKTTIGNNCIIYGKVGISKDLRIGDNTIILASSNVDKDLDGGKTYFGSPAIDARQKWKELAITRMLPSMWDKLKVLAKEEVNS
jgi:UDP-3-O-[3-hydroxymyristoyl] glucosamine N-acyltransferase